ncbi:hypothetical protein [Streptomyces sp. MST-110588]|uniref:hypothetical protein n=1 Tax=Streptomyces sp. MST-110588 TaxID=2833628 RepID=UPI001F5DB642|nr:hypothetical protein [Streptomyces sp. MST-110588]UNO38692.1 hypothetical protein KGS77_02295 [Streptomyces sp. MST-110588]
MSPTPPGCAGTSLRAAEANEAIRQFVRARRGHVWTAEDRSRYRQLLETWLVAVHGSVSGA